MACGTRIVTRRLRLRSWRAGDTATYYKACNTPEVMRWLGGVQSRAEVHEDVGYFAAAEKRSGFTFWAAERRRDNRFLGFLGIIPIEEDDCPFAGEIEIGWRLRDDMWRRGYGYEAATAVLDYAFSTLGLARIVSRTSKRNAASIALMRKLGLRRRPRMDYRPRVASRKLAVFAISAKQWTAQATRRKQRSERN